MSYTNSPCYNKKGYVVLLSILIVGAVGMAVTVSLLLLGLGSSRTSFAYEQSGYAKSLASACAEEALQQVRDSTPFTGSGSLSTDKGSCTYQVTGQGGQSRTIDSTGIVGTIVRKVKIEISSINPNILISTWQEVSDL